MTALNSATVLTTAAARAWRWPIDLDRYERHGLLTDEEAERLDTLARDFDQFRREGATLEAMPRCPTPSPRCAGVRTTATSSGSRGMPPGWC